ncbi:hypothetical protein Q7P37_003207 [Cladosporium fusiforme]
MSMVVTRSPLTAIGMNGAGAALPTRRSARLSAEGLDDDERPTKKTRVDGAQSAGAAKESPVKKKTRGKVYDNKDGDFEFTKRAKPTKKAAARNAATEKAPSAPEPAATSSTSQSKSQKSRPAPEENTAPQTVQKKPRGKLPTSPDENAAPKTARRSKRAFQETRSPSPHKAAHAQSHVNHDRSPSPGFRPVTVKKKRKTQVEVPEEEEKTMKIALPFADTPIIKRNKEMRKASADTNRRSSSGMRGRRASSLIDEGRGNALPGSFTTQVGEDCANARFSSAAIPHPEVPTSEFYKHISADLTEPRRMRCLLGWCGSRALPPKPDAPKGSSKEANAEFQALQAARVIQAELSQDLVSKGTLSDWFSRDDEPQLQVALRKKPNPRNIANAAKAEELERELERLKKERQEWDNLAKSAVPPTPEKQATPDAESAVRGLSPLNSDLLSSADRAIFAQLNELTTSSSGPTALQKRLQNISSNLEFSIDQLAQGVHAMATTRDMAERVADRSLKDATDILEERNKEKKEKDGGIEPMGALRGLAKVLNRGK